MGRFIYDTMANSVDIDDRTLAHLRIVVMNKLRRTEAFMFDVEVGDGSGRRSFWMHPSVPIQFHFFGSRNPRINRAWVEEPDAGRKRPERADHHPRAAGRTARRGVIRARAAASRTLDHVRVGRIAARGHLGAGDGELVDRQLLHLDLPTETEGSFGPDDRQRPGVEVLGDEGDAARRVR